MSEIKITHTFTFDQYDVERILEVINFVYIEDEEGDPPRLGFEELKNNPAMWNYFWEQFFLRTEEGLIEDAKEFVAGDGFCDILTYRP